MKTNILIQGQAFPCRVTMGAMLRFKRLTGKDVSALNDGDIEDLLTLLYCCVVSACKADGKDFSMDLESFADALDASEMNAFYASINEEKKTAMKAK